LYLHLFNWPESGKIVIPGILNKPLKAYLLADNDKSSLNIIRKDDALEISIPAEPPDKINTVLVLNLTGDLDFNDPPMIFSDFDFFVDSMKVSLRSDRKSVVVRYSVDGSSCDMKSPVYTTPLILKTSTVISARCFRDDVPVSGTVTKEFRKVKPNPGLTIGKLLPGVKYAYYHGNWDSVPDFDKLKPVKEDILDNFTLNPKDTNEYYGFCFTGYILVPASDVYVFSTNSDDGSILWIDDKKVVDNDALHPDKEVESGVALGKGYHKIRVGYFNKTGLDGLSVSIRSQGMKKQAVPSQILFHE
jgi:hypothetical protein